MTTIYVIFKDEKEIFIRKYLSKVEKIVPVSAKYLSNYFNKTNEPYKKNNYTIYKCKNVDLSSNNRGNKLNFMGK